MTFRYCGIIDAQRIGLVTSIERIMSHVFMEVLAHPSPDADADDLDNNCPMIKSQLLPGLRSFCSALKGNIDNKSFILIIKFIY